MPHPGNFWSRYTGLGAQKKSPKNLAIFYPKVSFLKTDNKIFSCVRNLNAYHGVKYSMTEENHRNFMQQLPKP